MLICRYLATAGMDRSLNIWDIRQMKPMQSYRVRGVPTSLSLSHKGCLAAATGNVVEVCIIYIQFYSLYSDYDHTVYHSR
jgi:WD40 repeat protein